MLLTCLCQPGTTHPVQQIGRLRGTQKDRERQSLNSNSKTLFYKDCRERERERKERQRGGRRDRDKCGWELGGGGRGEQTDQLTINYYDTLYYAKLKH